jgi:hypothetical protein
VTYTRIEVAVDLPPEGPLNDRAREKSDLDFKTYADPRQIWEHAKDVAAFANSLGGVLVIGADDKTGQLVYPGVHGQTVKDVQAIYEGAAQLCSPSPIVDVIPIPLGPTKNVVAVNVEPYLDQLVSAPAGTRDKNGKEIKHDAGWVFPIRRASQTEWIKPENLAMYMNREVRRAVLLLASIPAQKRQVGVCHHRESSFAGHPEVAECPLELGVVSVEANFVELKEQQGSSEVRCRVPLTDILDVWESETLKWKIKIRGTILHTPGPNGGVLRYGVPPH